MSDIFFHFIDGRFYMEIFSNDYRYIVTALVNWNISMKVFSFLCDGISAAV